MLMPVRSGSTEAEVRRQGKRNCQFTDQAAAVCPTGGSSVRRGECVCGRARWQRRRSAAPSAGSGWPRSLLSCCADLPLRERNGACASALAAADRSSLVAAGSRRTRAASDAARSAPVVAGSDRTRAASDAATAPVIRRFLCTFITSRPCNRGLAVMSSAFSLRATSQLAPPARPGSCKPGRAASHSAHF